MQEQENDHFSDAAEPPVIPRPIFMRLLVCFVAGSGFLLVGTFAAFALNDISLFVGAAVIGIVFICSGLILRKKVRDRKIYAVSGVCLDVTPKMYGRYSLIELIDVETGEGIYFTLPRKIAFKRGHCYTCYFDHPLHVPKDNIAVINESPDWPTSGFLGYEHFGLYREKSQKSIKG